MGRSLAGTLVALLLGTVVLAQSLAEIAEQERKRRKSTQGKVYTNDDLEKRPTDRPRPSPSPGTATPRAGSAAPRGEADSPAERRTEEAAWRARAAGARAAVKAAQNAVAEVQAKMRGPQSQPTPSDGLRQDPDFLLTTSKEREELAERMAAAQAALTAAREALSALEDEARRAGIPPGWLRER